MYERFTDRARKVLALANQEAQRFGHEYIGTEHILLGIAKEGMGIGWHVLKRWNVNLERIRQEVEKLVKGNPDQVTMGRIPQTPKAKQVLEQAIEYARSLNHHYVGTEHLLVGITSVEDGIGNQILLNFSIKKQQIKEQVEVMLGVNAGNATEQNASIANLRCSADLMSEIHRMANRMSVDDSNPLIRRAFQRLADDADHLHSLLLRYPESTEQL